MTKLGSFTAFAAEAALWVTGAALIASSAGVHLSFVPSSADVQRLIGAAPSPAASASPTGSELPGASPTASPISAKLMAFMAQHSQTIGKMWFTVTMTAGANTVTGSMSGTMSSDGQNNSSSLRTTMNGAVKTEDTVDFGKTSYVSTNGGSWTKSARAASGSSAETAFSTTMQFADAGVETKNGMQLHRLELLNPDSFSDNLTKGFASGITSTHENLTFWVRDDGSPVVMEIDGTLQGTSNGVAETGTMFWRLTFVKFSGVVITAPS